MLFLKTLSSIEVYHWHEGQAAPILSFSCTVSNPSAALEQERSLFARVSALAFEVAAVAAAIEASTASPTGTSPRAPLHASRPVALASHADSLARLRQGASSCFQLHLRITDHHRTDEGSVRRFLVCQAAAGGPAADRALELSKHLAAPLVPWGAVAADISEDLDLQSAEPGGGGQAFCFLPLPVRTGLPVHVNGFFELSSNRRDVWHGTDLAGAGAQRARWNLMLLEEAVAPAYAALIEGAASVLGHGPAYDRWGGALELMYLLFQCVLVGE